MVQTFNDNISDLLKKDVRFVDKETGELLRNEIINKAFGIDKELIESLLSDNEVKEKFFTEIKGHWIFEINKFVDYIQDKNFLSDSYTKFKNKIGLNIDGKFLNERKEVALVWPFKDCVLEGGMTKEDEKRNEIFFNEVLAQDEIDRLLDPKVLNNFKRVTAKGEEKVTDFKRDSDGTIRENLIIKGNNLLALHSLKKEFQGKVKLIYIDPPYNTGGVAETFTYNNNFDHSTWLTFMKNRLEVAKDFSREDGFITITIDHFELFYAGVLGDEVFGRENRIGIVTIVHKPEGRNQEKFFGTSNEFMLVYAKNKDMANFERVVLDEEISLTYGEEDSNGKFRLKNFIRLTDGKYSLRENKPNFYYPIYVSPDLTKFNINKENNYIEVFPITEKGMERTWKTLPKTFIKLANEGNIVAKEESNGIVLYEKLREDQVIKTHWIKKQYHAYHFGTKLLENLIGNKEFSFPKSLYAVVDTLKLMTSNNDIIMDFFAGSGTTGHATLELNKEDGGNRQFILIEQLDNHMNVILKRMKKVMENNVREKNLNNFDKNEYFVYGELLKYNEEVIDRIQSAKSTEDLIKIWAEMVEHYFLNYDVDIKRFKDNQDEFKKLPLEEQKKILVEMLNKNQLYVNLSEIEDAQFKVSNEDKELNKNFYGL